MIVLVGNIASGKTTMSKKLAKMGYRVISRDALRYMVGAGEYVFDVSLEHTIAEAHDNLLEAFLDNKIDVVIDEVNVQYARRAQFITMAKDYNYHIIALELPRLSKKISVDRRSKDSHGKFDRKIWEGVWDKFDKAYSSPTKKEGFDWVFKCDRNLTKFEILGQ